VSFDCLDRKEKLGADRLECLVQAREYEVQGFEQVTPWIESSQAALRSVTAKRLAEACLEVLPGDWWRVFLEQRRRHSEGYGSEEDPHS